jgi:hypothetical protein
VRENFEQIKNINLNAKSTDERGFEQIFGSKPFKFISDPKAIS